MTFPFALYSWCRFKPYILVTHTYRHPNTQARPEFKRILLDLVDREDLVLKVPKKDSASHKLAGLVGGPLEAGANMYTDLQWKYSTYN